MGTTNQSVPKDAKQATEAAKKKAENNGWQSMAVKFYTPKKK